MKKFLKWTFLLAFVFGGWVLAASSLHIVRAPGKDLWGYMPVKIRLVPKTNLSFQETWVDLTKWNSADIALHEGFEKRLSQAGKQDWLNEVRLRPAPAPAAQAPAPVPAPVVEKAAATEKVVKTEPQADKPKSTQGTTPAKPSDQPSRPTSIFDFSR